MTESEKTESNRRWVEQWRVTGPLLETIRIEELRALTEEHARAASEGLLAPVPNPLDWRSHPESDGFVEQQRIFARARR